MFISLPNLDDRRWVDLVEEGRALIPFYSPPWTDHNVHDPGITLVELFAWLAEMDIYQLNRIPERHLRKFLSLVGVHLEPPQPSLAPLSLALKDSLAADIALRIPVSVEFEGEDAFGQVTRFRALNNLTVVGAELKAIQVKDQNGFRDLTARWRRGETIEIFGEDPAPGAEFYLGFSHSPPVETPVSLLFVTRDLREGEELRRDLAIERDASRKRCRAPDALLTCDPKSDKSADQKISRRRPARLKHHSARLVVEFLAGKDRWQRLRSSSAGVNGGGEVIDDTRAFTLNGRILLSLPEAIFKDQIGQAPDSLHYLRFRIASGFYDAPPKLRHLALNGVFVEQVTPAGVLKWTIAATAAVVGGAPKVGKRARFNLQFNDKGEITHLAFVKDGAAPKFRLLEYRGNAKGYPGLLSIEAAWLGKGDGRPNLQLKLPELPALQSGFRLFTIENGHWREWLIRRDFDASGRADAHFLLDAAQGVVSFGDGERGRVAPKNAPVIARYHATRAGEGNLQAERITRLAATPHNRAILGDDFDKLKNSLAEITNRAPATGGAAAETLSHAIGRAIESVGKTQRAVTLADYEALAMETPGTQLARVSARANLHPSFPCLNAPGVITVIVLPYLPVDRPAPSRGLLRMVADYLAPRRVIGARVEVIGPGYIEVAAQARVKACAGVNKAELQRRIVASLDRFFHPLMGGPDGKGWPFGRDVFRSEVLQVIDETAGADLVFSLELMANGGDPQCGNICLRANELAVTGQHRIEVVGGGLCPE